MEINLSPVGRYSTVKIMKHLIKIAYDGSGFTGYQKGNGSRSVEDCIIRSLAESGIICSIRSAGRTDRGVSAISNCIEVVSDASAGAITGILGSRYDDLFPVAHAYVEDNFNVRHCDTKWYRYIVDGKVDIPVLEKVLKKFKGTHDFRNFCRRDERNTVRTIDSIEVLSLNGQVAVDFHGQSFVWQQIRTIMGYALEIAKTGGINQDPFSGNERYGKPAPPENLILMDVVYHNVEFRKFRSPSMLKRIDRLLTRAMRRQFLMSNILQLVEK